MSGERTCGTCRHWREKPMELVKGKWLPADWRHCTRLVVAERTTKHARKGEVVGLRYAQTWHLPAEWLNTREQFSCTQWDALTTSDDDFWGDEEGAA